MKTASVPRSSFGPWANLQSSVSHFETSQALQNLVLNKFGRALNSSSLCAKKHRGPNLHGMALFFQTEIINAATDTQWLVRAPSAKDTVGSGAIIYVFRRKIVSYSTEYAEKTHAQ